MSQENVEVVRRAYHLFNEEAFDRSVEPDLGFLDPDVEFDNSNAAFDSAVYRGHDGIREFVSLLRAMWQTQRSEPQEFIPVGTNRVVVPMRMTAVGRDGVEAVAHAANVFTLGDGKITHVKAFQTKADALAAVGPAE